jgi:hypothetical protein
MAQKVERSPRTDAFATAYYNATRYRTERVFPFLRRMSEARAAVCAPTHDYFLMQEARRARRDARERYGARVFFDMAMISPAPLAAAPRSMPIFVAAPPT